MIPFLLVISLSTGLLMQPLTQNDTVEAPAWRIDRVHSGLNFKIRHFFAPVPGTFNAWDGTIKFDPENLEGSSIDVTIDASSVDTKNERRDNHLRTADFFEVEKYPSIRFVSKRIEHTEGNQYIAHGDLTIKDVTTPIELPFTFLGAMERPNRPGQWVSGFQGEYTLMRTAYGVGTGSYVETTTIGDEVTIDIMLQLHR